MRNPRVQFGILRFDHHLKTACARKRFLSSPRATHRLEMTASRSSKVPKCLLTTGDVRDLAFGCGIPARIDEIIPLERHWKQRSSQAAIYEAV